jgi:hypothetical protein
MSPCHCQSKQTTDSQKYFYFKILTVPYRATNMSEIRRSVRLFLTWSCHKGTYILTNQKTKCKKINSFNNIKSAMKLCIIWVVHYLYTIIKSYTNTSISTEEYQFQITIKIIRSNKKSCLVLVSSVYFHTCVYSSWQSVWTTCNSRK